MHLRYRRLLSLLLVALTAVAALALSACGGDDSGDAKQTLRDGFSHRLPKATASINLQINAKGSPQLSQPVALRLDGPYDFSNPLAPKANLDLNASGGGASLGAKLLLTGDNAFVGVQGQNYEVGAEAWKAQLQQLVAGAAKLRSQSGKLETSSWIKDPKEDGDEDVAGAATTKVTGQLDLVKMLTDLNKASSQAQGAKTPGPTQQQIDRFKQVAKDPRVEVFVAKDDKTLRKVIVTLDFTIPESQRAQAQGATGGSATLTVQFSNAGQDVQVTAPTDARPLSELQSQVQSGGLGGLGGSSSGGASGGSSGGSGSSPSSDDFQKFADCLKQAGSDQAARQKCSDLIR